MRFYVFDSALFVYKVLLRFIGNLSFRDTLLYKVKGLYGRTFMINGAARQIGSSISFVPANRQNLNAYHFL